MISQSVHINVQTIPFESEKLKKGTWLVLLHAQRIPPHIGIIISGNYNSLTIKEREMNINPEPLLKTIAQKKIKSVFIKIAEHPVFSNDHRLSIFQEHLKKFEVVKQFEATCLSPIKLYFQEFYAVPVNEESLLFDFLQELEKNNYLDMAMPLNMELTNTIELPYYNKEELNEKIKSERLPYYND